jgi:UDP-N-acetylmuramate dehydrogenase
VVSTKHANFILNDGDASARDIEQLIAQVQQQVASQHGCTLTPEVRIVGVAA